MGRKRSESSKKAILRATLDFLKFENYLALSIEAIARKAGVGKQTIYRWWPSKGALVIDALKEKAEEFIPESQSADYAENLKLFLSSTFNQLTHPKGTGSAVCWLMAQAQIDPEFLVNFREDFIKVRREALGRVLRKNLDGQDHYLENEDFLMDIIFGAMWYRLLVGHADLDDAFAQQLADLIVQEKKRLQKKKI